MGRAVSINMPFATSPFSLHWLAFLLLHIAFYPLPALADDHEVFTGPIGRLIAKLHRGDKCAKENETARRIHFHDLNKDGKKDAIVLFTVEGAGCGNNYSFHMAAFTNNGKGYKLAGHTVIGGKWNAHPDFEKVEYQNDLIILYVQGHSENDSACCPSLVHKVYYRIAEGKIVKSKGVKK